MIFIAHRGNTNGPSENENKPDYIENTLSLGFHAEVDVWLIENKLFLGHDEPQYEISEEFLERDTIWTHAKNFEALSYLVKNTKINVFGHVSDPYVLTSRGYLFTLNTFTGKYSDNSICVMPESGKNFEGCFGICGDKFLESFRFFTS